MPNIGHALNHAFVPNGIAGWEQFDSGTFSCVKAPSLLRLSRLAVLDGKLLVGSIGAISDERLMRIRQRLAKWLNEAPG